MLDLAERLRGIAKAVRWIEPPADAPDRWDAANATRDEIAALIQNKGPVPTDPIIETPTAEPAKAPVDNWPEPPAEAAYHGVAGEIARAVAPHTEADPVALLGAILATFGAVAGDHRTLYQGSRQRANLFVALVGESGAGRKGTAGSIVRDVFDLVYPDWQRIVVPGLGSGEGLVGYLKRHEADPRALIHEGELGRLLGAMGREGSTLSPIIRDAWDGGTLGRVLAREETIIARHHVGILAQITPTELRRRLTEVDSRNGFANRFVWLAVRRTRLVPFPKSPVGLVQPFVQPLRRAIIEAQQPAELAFSPATEDLWEDLYAKWGARRSLGLAAAVTGRAEAQTARLALIYALLDRSPAIELVHLEAAAALWDYASRSAIHIFGNSTGNAHADELRRMLRDCEIPFNDAKRELGMRTAAAMAEAVAVLVDAGLAEVVEVARAGGSGGRPARVIRAVAS
jgi:hypothetical protein